MILMRGCIWEKRKNNVVKRSPYSKFFYSALISQQMLIDAVKEEEFFGFLEIDIFTPDNIKEQFRAVNYATIFNKIAATKEMLSPEMISLCEANNVKFPLKPQLTLVYEAKNYLLTSCMLKYYLEIGMIVTKIHSCIEYQRSQPLKKFIELSMF